MKECGAFDCHVIQMPVAEASLYRRHRVINEGREFGAFRRPLDRCSVALVHEFGELLNDRIRIPVSTGENTHRVDIVGIDL
jgi:hypothetical protein